MPQDVNDVRQMCIKKEKLCVRATEASKRTAPKKLSHTRQPHTRESTHGLPCENSTDEETILRKKKSESTTIHLGLSFAPTKGRNERGVKTKKKKSKIKEEFRERGSRV